VSGSGISWAICKSAPRPRQITTTSAPHHSVFYRLDALPAAQPTASKHTHTHKHPFNGPFSGTTRVSQYQKGNTNLDFTEETVSGSGISWAKSAPYSRQTTTPAPHHSVFTGRMPFLPPNQQRQSTEGKFTAIVNMLENL